MIHSVSPLLRESVCIHSSQYRNESQTLPAGSSGTQVFLVPFRCASLKSIWCLPRRSSETSSLTSVVAWQESYTLSSRVNLNISTSWCRIGSLLVPQKPITLYNNGAATSGYSEAYTECMISIHALNNANYGPSLGITCYQVADIADVTIGDGNSTVPIYSVFKGATLGASYQNDVILGQELETFSQRGDVLLSDMNTLGSQIFNEFSIVNAIVNASYVLDYYGYMDVIFVLDVTGLYSVRY